MYLKADDALLAMSMALLDLGRAELEAFAIIYGSRAGCLQLAFQLL